MAQALALDVIAEGVEEQEQLLALEQLGCQQVQGFLVSAAVPGDQLLAAIADWHKPDGRTAKT
jgi:EAL domain-containing protein (putative c-di-GMP-specific phosphodiesterase class I)